MKYIKYFFTEFAQILKSMIIFLIIASLAFLFSVIIVWPLWYTAHNFPTIYTGVVIFLVTLCIGYFTLKKMLCAYKKNKKRFLSKTASILLALATLILAVNRVLHGDRIVALVCIIITLIGVIFSMGRGKKEDH